jgi:hypothetical protein
VCGVAAVAVADAGNSSAGIINAGNSSAGIISAGIISAVNINAGIINAGNSSAGIISAGSSKRHGKGVRQDSAIAKRPAASNVAEATAPLLPSTQPTRRQRVSRERWGCC